MISILLIGFFIFGFIFGCHVGCHIERYSWVLRAGGKTSHCVDGEFYRIISEKEYVKLSIHKLKALDEFEKKSREAKIVVGRSVND